MTPFDRVTLALTVMRQLQHVVARETEALRQMKLAPLADLQAEKAALAASYERDVRELRASPEIFAALDEPVRESLAAASRELQATIAANVRALEAARQVVQGVVHTLGKSMQTVQRGSSYASSGRSMASQTTIPVAINREI